MLEQITDLVDRGRARVISQYRALTARFLPLLDVYTGAAQELEDAYWDFVLQLCLDTATDTWLERLGAIAGEARDGELDDDVYRGFIRARIAANCSQGLVEEILNVTHLVIGVSATLTIERQQPASLQLIISDFAMDDMLLLSRLKKLLGITRAAGVRLMVLYEEDETGDRTFTFSSDSTLQVDLDTGFPDPGTVGSGGSLAGASAP